MFVKEIKKVRKLNILKSDTCMPACCDEQGQNTNSAQANIGIFKALNPTTFGWYDQ